MSAPAPLTPPDCNLIGLDFMPLHVGQLFNSDIFALASGDEFKAALSLWGKSWHETPAASLTDDELVLAAKAGVTLQRWRELAPMALRGWIKCSDGRLYHKVVAREALNAWKGRIQHRRRSAAGNAKKRGLEFDPRPFDAMTECAERHLEALTAMTVAERGVSLKEPKPLPQGAETAPLRRQKSSEGTGTGTVDDDGDARARASHAPERPPPEVGGAVWLQRLADIRVRYGPILGATPGAQSAKHLRDLCEPHAGIACDWERDLAPAVEEVLGHYLERNEIVHSLGVVKNAALRNRDRRLAGLPDLDPKNLQGERDGARKPNRSGSIAAAGQWLLDRTRQAEAVAGRGGEFCEGEVVSPRKIGAG